MSCPRKNSRLFIYHTMRNVSFLLLYARRDKRDLDPIPVIYRERKPDELESVERGIGGVEWEMDQFCTVEHPEPRDEWEEEAEEIMQSYEEELNYKEERYDELLEEWENDIFERRISLTYHLLIHTESIVGIKRGEFMMDRLECKSGNEVDPYLEKATLVGVQALYDNQVQMWEYGLYQKGKEWLLELEKRMFGV